MLEVLESPTMKVLFKRPVEWKLLMGQCHLHQGNNDEAAEVLMDILSTQADDWTCIHALLHLYLPIKDVTHPDPVWQRLCRESCQLVWNLNPLHPDNAVIQQADSEKAEAAMAFIRRTLTGIH